jgi:hypothetical protein
LELANDTIGFPQSAHYLDQTVAFWRPQGDADWTLATKSDIEAHFAAHGTGKITEIKLMNGFGFIEYEDAMDARDVVPGRSCKLLSSLMTVTNSSQPSVCGVIDIIAQSVPTNAFQMVLPSWASAWSFSSLEALASAKTLLPTMSAALPVHDARPSA